MPDTGELTWPPTLDAASQALESSVTFFHAIEFANVEGFRPLQLDLYLPRRASRPTPVIVYFHGGGWSAGTRRRFGRAFAGMQPTPMWRLADAGFAVASVDYRLSGEAVFPAQLDDARSALAWVRANAVSLNVDPTRVVSWGESAGGHIALLLGLAGPIPDSPEHDVSGIVAWYPPTDLLTLADQHLPTSTARPNDANSQESRLLGAALTDAPDRARAASPITYVRPGAPPVQLHHGDADTMVPVGQSISLADALEAVEAPVELVILPGTEHFWIGAPSIEAIFNASLAFARQVTASS